MAMGIGVSQRLKKSAFKHESLEERATAWLLSSRGITKAVVLIEPPNPRDRYRDSLSLASMFTIRSFR